MKPQRRQFPDLRCCDQARHADERAESQREGERLVGPTLVADRRTDHQQQEHEEKGGNRHLAQRKQPREPDGAHRRKAEIVADIHRSGNVGAVIEAADRRDPDLQRRNGPGRNEIARQKRAIERTDPPILGHAPRSDLRPELTPVN